MQTQTSSQSDCLGRLNVHAGWERTYLFSSRYCGFCEMSLFALPAAIPRRSICAFNAVFRLSLANNLETKEWHFVQLWKLHQTVISFCVICKWMYVGFQPLHITKEMPAGASPSPRAPSLANITGKWGFYIFQVCGLMKWNDCINEVSAFPTSAIKRPSVHIECPVL